MGWEHRLSEGTRAQLEVYRKDYDRVPVLRDADQVAPEGVLLNTGEKLVRGVDLLLEHARPSGLTLAATASFSKALARDHLGGWFPDDFDYRRIAAVSVRVPTVAGVFAGLRWRYVGGRPFTLFPVERLPDGTYRPVPSAEGRNRLRYPAYRRLDLRLDRRFDFGGWGLSLFLEVQNLTNRENVFSRQFNKRTGEFKDLKEFPRMTLLGIIGDF
ncbi:MAG: hypothetical protein KatS3mg115_2010 [Candidatus Poribacteria bacterium]|nr:MAG: hypothetical protein KatS3mg115_2010 [Candidatus Poribacteria bacterium]